MMKSVLFKYLSILHTTSTTTLFICFNFPAIATEKIVNLQNAPPITKLDEVNFISVSSSFDEQNVNNQSKERENFLDKPTKSIHSKKNNFLWIVFIIVYLTCFPDWYFWRLVKYIWTYWKHRRR